MSAARSGPSLCLAVALAAATTLLPRPASAAECGTVLAQSTALDSDITCGPGQVALIVAASNITVDLKGHTITGPYTGMLETGGIGVLVAAPFTGVQIRNGTIRGFGIGVRLDQTSGNTVRTLTLLQHVRGVDVANANANLIEKNRIANSALDAVRLGGISSGNVVVQNTLSANVFGLGAADDSSANTLAQNTVTGGGAWGIAVFTTGAGNVVSRNTVTGTAVDGIVVSATSVGTLVTQNGASGNGRHGVFVDAGATGTHLEQNTVTQNGDDGLHVRSTATTLTKNTATYNTDLGIEAIAGVTDGGGNTAYGNGNPLQCTGVACSP